MQSPSVKRDLETGDVVPYLGRNLGVIKGENQRGIDSVKRQGNKLIVSQVCVLGLILAFGRRVVNTSCQQLGNLTEALLRKGRDNNPAPCLMTRECPSRDTHLHEP